jgi:large subunit ribosomal protein L25
MSVAEAFLGAQRRDESGKGVARRLRRAGRIPAVVYGKGMEPVPLSLDEQETVLLFHSIPVENTVLTLSIGDEATLRTLVREIQTHPYRSDILHVDFLRVRKGVAVEVNVPFALSGTAIGTRSGGRLDVVVHEVQVRCTPSKIPESIQLDISGLDIGDSIRLGDITFDDDIELLANPDSVVCHVTDARVIEEEEEEDGELVEDIEEL